MPIGACRRWVVVFFVELQRCLAAVTHRFFYLLWAELSRVSSFPHQFSFRHGESEETDLVSDAFLPSWQVEESSADAFMAQFSSDLKTNLLPSQSAGHFSTSDQMNPGIVVNSRNPFFMKSWCSNFRFFPVVKPGWTNDQSKRKAALSPLTVRTSPFVTDWPDSIHKNTF